MCVCVRACVRVCACVRECVCVRVFACVAQCYEQRYTLPDAMTEQTAKCKNNAGQFRSFLNSGNEPKSTVY